MNLATEARALESLSRLLKTVDECRALFDEAGMDYPAPLRRILGDSGQVDPIKMPDRSRRSLRIPPPPVERPPGVPDGWIHVPIASLSAETVVLGVLREASAAVPVKQIGSQVRARRRDTSDGTIANVGTRLDAQEHKIKRSADGWSLIDKASAPILSGDHAWGTPEMFMKHELAARRREAVVHVLHLFPSGLMNMQIVEQLEACSWLKTPLSKDLVKVDMEELKKASRVKRVSHTNKWVSAEETP